MANWFDLPSEVKVKILCFVVKPIYNAITSSPMSRSLSATRAEDKEYMQLILVSKHFTTLEDLKFAERHTAAICFTDSKGLENYRKTVEPTVYESWQRLMIAYGKFWIGNEVDTTYFSFNLFQTRAFDISFQQIAMPNLRTIYIESCTGSDADVIVRLPSVKQLKDLAERKGKFKTVEVNRSSDALLQTDHEISASFGAFQLQLEEVDVENGKDWAQDLGFHLLFGPEPDANLYKLVHDALQARILVIVMGYVEIWPWEKYNKGHEGKLCYAEMNFSTWELIVEDRSYKKIYNIPQKRFDLGFVDGEMKLPETQFETVEDIP